MPNPGSPEARQQGCRCPVLDNSHGKGYMGLAGEFVVSADCPIHSAQDKPDPFDCTGKPPYSTLHSWNMSLSDDVQMTCMKCGVQYED